ncbi:pentraxin fusion protein-like [Myxocyprinus asiaticus]|uniref:pentraxin fusion protein-like n=1 Tax=Myxocyprinus asiaticus TaxID=70543 RepID=UPI002221AEC4|nr:pentraxin fusion protein-like [Myxocyprinus asiaticus]
MVTITNRGDCRSQRIEGVQIRIGNSLENNGNNNELFNNQIRVATVESIPAGGTATFTFKDIEGQFVNIFLPGNNKILTLCEVQVFADVEIITQDADVKDEELISQYTVAVTDGEYPPYIEPTSQAYPVSENLASGARAVQSSTYSQLGIAENAVDGNKESEYFEGSCTHTAAEKNPWWRVDLTEVHKVTMITITNRADCCEERIIRAQIHIGNSLENNGNNNELAATVGSIRSAGTETFIFNPIEGRYVNIFLPGDKKVLTLCEVQVFAVKTGAMKTIHVVVYYKLVVDELY